MHHYSLGPVLFHQVSSSNAISVQLIALYVQSNKRITLRFIPDNPAIVSGLEGIGEYIRDTTIVNIMDVEGKPLKTWSLSLCECQHGYKCIRTI